MTSSDPPTLYTDKAVEQMEAEVAYRRCPACRGTGWAPDVVHPIIGPLLNCHKDCPACGGTGQRSPEPPEAE